MQQTHGQGLEAITVRRTHVVDADKVRYRVYKSPTEFVAVIAESALLAVRVSGIANPHKIVRDLPTDGIAIDAKKMAVSEERVTISSTQQASSEGLTVELSRAQDVPLEERFVPLGIMDLRQKGQGRLRILPPTMVLQIIEDYGKQAASAPAEEAPVVAPALVPPPEPAALAPSSPPPEPAPLPEPALLAEEAPAPVFEEVLVPEDPAARVLAMADAILPSVQAPVRTEPLEKEEILSPNEVQRLLSDEE